MRTSKNSTYSAYRVIREGAPDNYLAEMIDGTVMLSPRPAGFHGAVAFRVALVLGERFSRGGDPGGWIFVPEPELHVPVRDGHDELPDQIVIPDLAGWRHETLPFVEDSPFFTTVPDWVCEVVSPSTERHDRGRKLRIYGEAGVPYLWFIDPRRRQLEVFKTLDYNNFETSTFHGDATQPLAPFASVPFDLSRLWLDLAPATRANEPQKRARRKG